MIFSAFLGRGTTRFGHLGRLLITVSVFSALIFSKTQVFAQDLPDASQGINPESTYYGSDIDFVDMVTGRLNLHIPLVVDHSQRGNLNFTYSLYFSGQTWFDNYVCNRAGCTSSWKLIKGTNEGLVFGIDGHLNSASILRCTVQTCGYAATAEESAADDGSVHPLGTVSVTPSVMESIDGSGIRSIVNSAGISVLINGNGIQTSEPSFNATTGAYTKLIEDPNGNEITIAGNITNTIPMIMTDTLGRTWTQTFGSTNVTGCPVAAVNSTLWDIPGPANINSGIREIKFCYSNVPIQTHFNQSPVIEYSGTWKLMTGVVLPDGTTWRFDYNSYGDPAKVYLPTGGTITYQYVTGDPCGNGNGLETASQRTLYDGTNSNIWQYNHIANSLIGGIRVTDPLGNDTVYNPVPKTTPPYKVAGAFSTSCAMGTSSIQYFNGSYNSGTLLSTVTKTYQAVPNPYLYDINGPDADPIILTGITTAYANGQTAQTQQTYDSGFTFTDTNSSSCCNSGNWQGVYGLVATKTQYDYGNGTPGPVLSSTNTNYLALSNSGYLNANLLNLVSSEITLTALTGGNKCAETDYGYDVASQILASGVTEQHVAAPSPGILGDLTSVTQQLSSTPCQSAGSWSTVPPTNEYVYDTGMLQKSVDPLTNPTTYSYSGTYYGAYPTTITNAPGQQTNYTYDLHTGLVTAIQGPNDLANGRPGATYAYDVMLRPTQVNYQDGGQTTIAYNYAGNVFVGGTVTQLATPDPSIVTNQVFDGLGRLKETQLTSDSAGTDYTDITYDPDGRKYKVYNPTRCNPAQTNCGESTWGFITFLYDALNRPCLVAPQDAATPSGFTCPTTAPVDTVFTQYSGNTTTVTDEAGKQRKSQLDGQGRLTGVWEDPNGLNYQTSYSYDALDDLLSVTQSSSRQRGFSYDSLSRLTQATNPESGTINYSYDANGNMTTKTDARSVTTTYCYDAMNRVVGKRYASATCPLSSPDVFFTYDLTTTSWGEPTPNSIGRLSWAQANNSAGCSGMVFGYDPMGRVTTRAVSTPVNCGLVPYITTGTYDLAGDLTSLTYPSGRVVTSQYNGAMQPTQVTFASFNGTSIGYNYASGASYAPTGAPTSVTLGSGAIETDCYNNRLQPGNMQVASGGFTWLNRTYNFYPSGSGGCSPGSGSNNGNVMSIADNLQPTRTQTFGYDNLNRISSAQSAATSGADCWGQSFGYDAWANLLAENVTKCSGTQLSVGVNGQNQITNSGISYDASGDMLTDGINTYTFDADSRISTVNGTAATYTYDAEGQRVYKQNGSNTTEYVYFSGQPIAERNASGLWNDYIFAGSRRLAIANGTNENSIPNGSFEQGLTPWYTNGTLISNAANAHSGNNYLWMSSTGAQMVAVAPWAAVNPGDQLTFGGWVYLEAGTGGPPGTGGYNGYFLALINASGGVITYCTPGGTITLSSWSYLSGTCTVPAGAVSVQFYAQIYQPTSNPTTIRFDDAFLSTGTAYYHADHLGSARFMSDTGGNVIWSATYLPFGQEWNPQATVNHYKFTGKERDAESGLDYFGARRYSSQYGRFTSADPINLTSDRLSSPSTTLNKYAYAADNPLGYIDRDGKDIKIFYRPPSCTFCEDFGHVFLGALNQDTGQVGFLDFFPANANSGNGPGQFGNVQDRAGQLAQYASLTIQTTPEEAQKVLDFIKALTSEPPPDYHWLSNNCTTVCEDALRDLGIDMHNLSPKAFWNKVYRRYSKYAKQHPTMNAIQSSLGVSAPNQGGVDYGNPRYNGTNYGGQLFQIYQVQQPDFTSPVSVCVDDGQGNKSCDSY